MNARLFPVLTGAFFAAFLPALPGQTSPPPFVRAGKALIPPGPVGAGLYAADVDGDKDLDLVVLAMGRFGDPFLFLLRNDGKGRFAWDFQAFSPAALGGDFPRRVFLRDVDGDGAVDLILGARAVYRNDGKGRFRADPKALPKLPRRTWLYGAADVEGDKDPDLLVVQLDTRPRKALFLVDDGKGQFTASSSLVPPRIDAPIVTQGLFLDVDGDGDPDYVSVVGGDSLTPWTLWLSRNDGKGNFQAPVLIHQGLKKGCCFGITAGDVNGDGAPDLFVENLSKLFLNDGKGGFKDVTSTNLPPSFRVTQGVFGDFDGDGDLDLAGAWEGRLLFLENKGKGVFAAPVERANLGWFFSGPLAAGDLDGDGDLDLAFPEGGGPLLLLNDGKARFLAASGVHTRGFRLAANGYRRWSSFPALGDVNGDGVLDLVADCRCGEKRFLLFFGDGNGGFRRAPAANMPVKPGQYPSCRYRIHLLDVDGDGDLDLLAFDGENQGSDRNVLYLNDGKGVFKDVSLTRLWPPFRIENTSFVSGDFDKDGDPDLILGGARGGGVYLWNDGKGSFTRAPSGSLPLLSQHTWGIAAGDLDGDGDLDLVWAASPSSWAGSRRVLVLRNDGKGRFTAGKPFLTDWRLVRGAGLFLADVDGDGDLDLFMGMTENSPKSPFTLLFLNDGKGNFRKAASFAGLPAAAPDLDGDGDSDLVVYGHPQGASGFVSLQAFRNDGKGRFTGPLLLDPTLYSRGSGEEILALPGDLDRDGLTDLLVFPEALPYPYVLFNSRRHLRAPWPCSIGKDFRLEVFGRPGRAALLLAGLKPGSTPLPPFGILRLDPSWILPLSPMLTFKGPKAWWQGKVPKDAALLGRELFFQALVLDPVLPGRSRFTGFVRDKVGAW